MRSMAGSAVWLVALAAAWPAAAQEPAPAQPSVAVYSGRTISDVQVFIERAPASEPALVEVIETRRGRPLSLAAVRESITHLYSLGRFQDVQVDASASADGVALRYNLIPLHHVERVDFKGPLGLSEGTLRRTMSERFGATPPVGRAAEVARLLQQLYGDHGYFSTTITPAALELHDPDRTILTFTIDPGPRTTIGRIVLSGQPRAAHAAVLDRLDIEAGRPYERVELQRRLTGYVADLKKRRYYMAAANHTAELSDDARTADLTVDIQSGPLVRVTFVGDDLPRDRLRELVPIEREGSADEDLREDSAQRIRDYLHSQGNWKADVTVEERQGAEALEIVFTIRRGPVYRVEAVDVTGTSAVAASEILPLIPVAGGDVFVSSRLDAGVSAIRQFYRSRGFAWVDVKSAVTEIGLSGEGRVRPSIAIVEGARAVVGDVTINGAKQVAEDELRAVTRLRPGQPWYDPIAAGDRDALLLEYLNRGYAVVEVTATPVVSSDRTRVDLLFDIREGPQTTVDHILIVGNRRTDEDLIRREILLKPGAPLGLQDLIESRRRLSALALFRRVNITELTHGGATRRDVVITVEEAPATNIGYGGGLEVARILREGAGGDAEERFELAPRGFFEIGRRNLGGKNRSVNLYTRVSVRPNDPNEESDGDGGGFGFNEYRVIGTYREPRAFGWNADFTLLGAAEQGVRSSFDFTRRGITVEFLRRLTASLRGSTRYSFSTTRTFNETLTETDEVANTIDRLFPQVRLSAFSGAVARDSRDDLVDPARGTLLTAEGTLAARALGGEVGFVKTYVQAAWFARLPGARQVVFATRAATGLADGFPREAQPLDENDDPLPGPPIVIEDLPASERFFAGGDITVRGFALDTLGAPNTINARGFPRGGNAVLILNGELRVPMWRDIGAAIFVDGGNVFDRVTEFDLAELRGSAGFGLRYRSPIGSVRLDVGFKMDRREGESRQVLHFSIGQAF
jgi:outer membrane protein assembly complex protein YaeT